MSFHPVCRKCRKRHLIGECQVDRLWGVVALMIWGFVVVWLMVTLVKRFF